VNIFLADMKDFAAVNEVYVEAFPEPRPVCYYFLVFSNDFA
jgi:enamine deaminase RidA (YjgF/YER057c/UK114 family)